MRWDGRSEPAGDHGVDANDVAASVGKRPARIPRREADGSLHPPPGTESGHRTNGVDDPRGERTNKSERVADGHGPFAGPHAGGGPGPWCPPPPPGAPQRAAAR